VEALKAHARAQHGTAAAGVAVISPGLLVTLLSLQTITISFCLTIPVVHLVPLVMSYGYDTTTAAGVYSTIFIAGIVGRVLLGKLMDVVGGLPALIIATGLPALTIYGLTQVQTLPMLYGVTAVFGFGFGGVLGTYSVIIRSLVPPHLTGRSVGWVFFWGYLALGVGGYVGGVLYDATGNYLATYAVGAASGLISLATAMLLTLFVRRRQARAAAMPPA
jgi:MFS family permease